MKHCVQGFVLPLIAVVACATGAQAATLFTITHDYGSAAGQMAPPSLGVGTCDTLNANSVTIRDSSGCQRFYDLFDFSGTAGTVTSFELDLTFDSTNQTFAMFFPEDWRVRPAISPSTAVTAGSEMPALVRSGSSYTQTFTFDNTLSIFNTIVANEVFGVWFAENALGANNFNLHSATLRGLGEPPPAQDVPEPTSVFLLGLGMLGAAARLRRRQ